MHLSQWVLGPTRQQFTMQRWALPPQTSCTKKNTTHHSPPDLQALLLTLIHTPSTKPIDPHGSPPPTPKTFRVPGSRISLSHHATVIITISRCLASRAADTTLSAQGVSSRGGARVRGDKKVWGAHSCSDARVAVGRSVIWRVRGKGHCEVFQGVSQQCHSLCCWSASRVVCSSSRQIGSSGELSENRTFRLRVWC